MKPISLLADYSISLAEFLQGYSVVPESQGAIVIQDLKLDSREIVSGDLFVALQGCQDNGIRYINAAAQKGACAALVDQLDLDLCRDYEIPLVAIKGLRQNLSKLAGRFFREPSSRMRVVGVTGTNGKTSCVQFISQALSDLGRPCGSIGTLGFGSASELFKSERTTPDAISLQRMLAFLAEEGATAVALEVSSHAIDQYRVNGIEFDTLVFTNLSHDHLDYHGSMEAYAATKKRLFLTPGVQHAVINADDRFGEELIQQLSGKIKLYRYGLNASGVEARASDIQITERGLRARLDSVWGQGIISSPLLGRFNLSNLLAVYAVLCAWGVSVDEALQGISKLTGASGRMQHYGGGNLPLVVVDYAHTPEALALVLEILREFCEGQLWCIFGCGGDRDRGKRPIMGQIAESMADHLVLTSDNPRTEKPAQIIEEILSGLSRPENAKVYEDRSRAIAASIESAQVDDVILIAGKGHENYQEMAGVRVALSDSEQARGSLNARARKFDVGGTLQ